MRRYPSLACTIIGLVLLATVPNAASADPVVVAAGDIACDTRPCLAQRLTARLIGRVDPRAVLTLGDNQYPTGALSDFRSSYDPTWGRFRRRTHPSPGNHEYGTPGARGYFSYFGRRAHPRRNGTYAFNLGKWHLVSINSGRGYVTAAHRRWVRRNLRADHHVCELAYWHHPRWSSGVVHGSLPAMRKLWGVLFATGVDVVLNGHEHNYERFAPMTPAGRLSRRGIRQFVVGTGGAGLYPLGPGIHGSRRRIDGRFGVLRLNLHERRYDWRFMAAAGGTLDRGSDRCHR